MFVVAEIEACDDDSSEELLPLSLEHTKVDSLEEPSNVEVPEDESENDKREHQTQLEIDTLDAHAELIKMREKLRAEKEAEKDQVRLHFCYFGFMFAMIFPLLI